MSDKWLPVAEAARVSRLSESTARRHIRNGRLPTRTGDGGVALVDVEAARALARLPRSATAAAKRTPTSVATAGGGGEGGGGGGAGSSTAPRDGELAARVFAALEAGSRPVDLVTQLQAAPADVAALVRAWQDLRSTESNTLADRVGVLEGQVVALETALAAVRNGLPPEDARCPGCGRAHVLGVTVSCTGCGSQAVIPPAPAPAAAS